MASRKLKVGSVNARGLHDIRKRISLFHWINKSDLDIALIQETYCTKEFDPRFNFQWNGDVYHSYTASSHAKGVCILLSKNFNGEVMHSCADEHGRRILLDIKYGDKIYTIVNLYCPTNVKDRIEFLKESTEWVRENRNTDSYLIIGGDVNCVELPCDRASGITDKSTSSLKDLKRELSVTDAWRQMHPGKKEFTYVDPSYRNLNSRIDILCVCKELETCVEICEHRLAPCPDHKAIIMTLRCNDKKRGKGYWKLNVSILKEDEYKECVRSIILDTIAGNSDIYNVDKGMIWELVKIRVKEFSVLYSCERSKRKANNIRKIEAKLNNLDQKLQCDSNNKDMIVERKTLKHELDDLYLDRAIGAQIRSKVKCIESGERSTSYFLAVEKHRQSYNSIAALKDNGVTYTGDNEILKVARDFYKDLYASKNPKHSDISNFLNNIEIQELSQEQQLTCENDISIQECEDSISKMKSNKSPGEDGLPIEFYKVFWNEIGHFLVEMYNECFTNEILPMSMRKSVITLIHKKDDKDNIVNYRPISLTNTDYRILAFVLSSRLQNVASHIVNPDQVAYIKKRFIGTNVRIIQDIFELYNRKNKSGILMFVDFKKAFDSIEWEFLFEVLGKFNFGETFIKWVKLLYAKPCAFVKNNGHFSDEFSLSRGVRQGCPVSSLLFILCMEVLSCYIQQNNNIMGLSLDDQGIQHIKLVQYADDSTLFLRHANELKEAIKCIEVFGSMSGTELNRSKCEGLWLGSSKYKQKGCTLHDIRWPTKPIRSLGIYIGHDTKECYKLNYDDKVANIDNVLNQAAKRNLTLFGKVYVIKSLALSKIIYISMCLSIPDKVVKEIDQIIFRFLWGKRDRIKRKSIKNKLENGGLNMIDVMSQFNALKASWVGRIISAPNEHLWSYLPKQYLSKFGEDYYILKTTFDHKTLFPLLTKMPMFYQDIVIAYNKSKVIEYDGFQNTIKRQPIWGNKFIKFKNKTLFFKSWVSVGIMSIENLRIINGKLDAEYISTLVKDKRQFHTELNILQKALKLANVNISNEPSRNVNIPVFIHQNGEEYGWGVCNRSKYYYNNLIECVRMSPTSEMYWTRYGNYRITEDLISYAYMQRIKLIKDMKLAETNFKILNNILPCNRNLYKWRKIDSNVCKLCNEEETISHLLYECKYIQTVWKVVSRGLFDSRDVTHNMVIFGSDLSISFNYVFSMIIYCIYKEWLVCSLEKRTRRDTFCIKYLSYYLTYRKNIYSKCNGYIWHNICDALDDFIRIFDQS